MGTVKHDENINSDICNCFSDEPSVKNNIAYEEHNTREWESAACAHNTTVRGCHSESRPEREDEQCAVQANPAYGTHTNATITRGLHEYEMIDTDTDQIDSAKKGGHDYEDMSNL